LVPFLRVDKNSVINSSMSEHDLLQVYVSVRSHPPYLLPSSHLKPEACLCMYGVCAILLRLYTSTERLKRLYTSPGSLLEIFYIISVIVLIIIYNFYFNSFYLKLTHIFKIHFKHQNSDFFLNLYYISLQLFKLYIFKMKLSYIN
jgi:hypothetical protein